jgi:arylsulfatase A-like enzyme
MPRVSNRRPNVVLFVVDDMGWTDSGAYGSTYYETPHIDALAQAGTMFTDAYAASPLCSPTRASLLTGKYPARLGVTAPDGHLYGPDDLPPYPESAPPNRRMISPQSRRHLPPGEPTLAATLRDAGYRTGHFGKWHLGAPKRHWPERRGFDVAFHGVPDPGPPRPHGYWSPYSFKRGTITPGPDGEHMTDRLAEEAVHFIADNAQGPFFLNLWHFAVHGPWDHREEYTREFARRADPRGVHANPIMASMLRSVDDSLARVRGALRDNGVAEDTIVVLTSDHGGNVRSNLPGYWRAMGQDERRRADWLRWADGLPPTSNAPLRDGKGSLYEGGVRVPLVVSWPGGAPGGVASSAAVTSTDLFPTLLELLDLPAPEGGPFDGASFAGALAAGTESPRECIFNFQPNDKAALRPAASVRRGNWKLIRWFTPDGPRLELYDLESDIGESRDLAGGRPELARELDRLIDGFLEDTGALLPIPNPAYEDGA